MKEFGRIMSIEEYHALPELSKSGVDEMRITPHHYWYKYRNPKREPFEMTPSMRIGSAFHYMIGEPELVDIRLAGMPEDMIRRGKAWDAFKLEHDGKIILSFNEMETAREMDRAMRAHPIYKVISRDSIAERSFFFTCPITGAKLKIRPDLVNLTERMAFDFKSTADLTDEEIRKTFHNFNYRTQGAMIIDGLNDYEKVDDWQIYFVAIENSAPYAVRIFEPVKRATEDGRKIYQTQAARWMECEKANEWPSFSHKINPIDLPTWYKP